MLWEAEISRFGFIHILRVLTPNELNKARLQEFYKFECDHESPTPIWENKEKRIRKKIQLLGRK